LLVFVLVLIGLAGARAQQPEGQPPPAPPPATLLPGIEVLAVPYVWFPWIGAGIRPADTTSAAAGGPALAPFTAASVAGTRIAAVRRRSVAR